MTTQSTLIAPEAVPGDRPRPRRCLWTAQERAQWLELFERSGQSSSEFCRENDLAEATLSLWRRQARETEEQSLVEIPGAILKAATESPAPACPSAVLVIQLPNAVRLEVAVDTDPVWVGQLVQGVLACSI